MERISKHISYKEGVFSNTATRLNIDNTPGQLEFSNMGVIADNIFEPLRKWVNAPIKITSFYRSPNLNKALGGSYRSQHCEGRAMDIDDVFGRTTNALMFEYIKNNLDFDQLIWEFGNDTNPDWIHVSFCSPAENRSRCLRAFKLHGKTHYKEI
jgi:zinc D-Ala-D-Ala carboxypeptidase|tara:strand:- start:434 stop:895 length:462 start_codon:yes stop_codon:yes gene_type:complete